MALGFASIHTAIGQDRCGTVEYTKRLYYSNPLFEREKDFEDWIRTKVRTGSQFQGARTQAATYQIPVVVHIIHNGEAVGSGSNIPDAQVLSQIKVLNQDFRRENVDRSKTPPEFAAVAGSMDIEFVLARRDPNGLATTGIVRVDGDKPSWTSNDNYELKALSYWPAEDYMNIWVCNITDFLGYAQFPVSNLPGLENSSNNRLTDGVVLWYRALGSANDGSFNLDPDYNKGRTATHEVSHFFGLRHTWGDDDNQCSGTDYVADTPNQAGFTSGCPTGQINSCGVSNMYQNFLDYTDDDCMNLFTQGQIERMIIVMQNSPRRASLLVSPGLLTPDPVPNDLGIVRVVSPSPTHCDNVASPEIEIRNFGTTTISSVRIRMKVNSMTVQTQDFTLDLAPQVNTRVSFSNINLSNGITALSFEILLTNGTTDGDALSNDNILNFSVFVPSRASVPIVEDFSTMPSDWTIFNPDQQITWEIADAPDEDASNTALLLRFYDYVDNIGERDILYSPVFDLSDATSAVLLFDIAHARYDLSNDELKVIAITACRTLADGTLVYDSTGLKLATTAATRSYFVPGSPVEWETEFVSLDQFVGQSSVQLAFVGINDYGNNLYLDNIFIAKSPIRDVRLGAIRSPGMVTCDLQPAPVISILNTGTEEVNSITIQTSVSSVVVATQTFAGLQLSPGKGTDLTIARVLLRDGVNELSHTVTAVNGAADDNASNNSLERKIIVSRDKDRIPLRENFENDFSEWTITNRTDGMLWQTIDTNFGTSLYFNSFSNNDIGDQAWFVSPVLDFSRTDEASLRFDLSYVAGPDARESFRVMVSNDCGNTYQTLDFEIPGNDTSSGSWAPQSQEDWFTNEIDLSAFAGEDDVRIAFVVTNSNGNNLYIDNIEFFITAEPNDIPIESPYSVFGYDLGNMVNSQLKVGFNLPERQNVYVQIVDTMGRVVSEAFWEDVLNQIFDLPVTSQVSTGVYIVRLKIGGSVKGTRVFLNK